MNTKNLKLVYWIITIAAFIATTVMVATYTPTEATMGPVQKIFYVHLPVAINTFVAAMIVFIASIGYLWQRKMWWDDLASAAARVTVVLCSIVLLTGMVWGKSAWGAWWTWSPRLTFSLVLWLLYVVYLMVRPSIDSEHRRALVAAVYGVIAFLDVPLVWLSTRLMPDIHPTSIEMTGPMKLTLLAWFLPVTLWTIGLLVSRYRLNVAVRNQLRVLEDEQQAETAQVGEAT